MAVNPQLIDLINIKMPVTNLVTGICLSTLRLLSIYIECLIYPTQCVSKLGFY